MVCGSRHTLNFPFGFLTNTKLWHQSVALLISNFLITFSSNIWCISFFNGSIITCGIFLGGCTTGGIDRSTSSFHLCTIHGANTFKQVRGKSSIICALQSGLSFKLMSTGGSFTFGCYGCLDPVLLETRNLWCQLLTFSHSQCSLQLIMTRLKALQNCRSRMTLVLTMSVT